MISLSKIAEGMEGYFPDMDLDTLTRTSRRAFIRFIEAGGGNVFQLKDESGNMFFDDQEAIYVEAILTQLLRKEGMAYEFSKKRKHSPSSHETRDMIQDVLDSIDESVATEETLQRGVNFLDMLFQLSYRQNIECCHRLIDSFQMNISPYLYTYQLAFSERLKEILLRENVRSATESAIYCSDLVQILDIGKELGDGIKIGDMYGEPGDPIRREYEQRDARVVESLKSEAELRKYVENKTGCNIEIIYKKYFT